VDLPEPSTIYGAYKLTGRLADRWTVGTLGAVTANNEVRVAQPNGQVASRVIEPLTAFNILRLKRDLGDNAHVGMIATSATRVEASDASRFCPDGSVVALGARCFHDAYTGGVDYKLRSDDFAMGGQLFATGIHAGPPRTLLDGTVVASGDTGGGGEVWAGKEGGPHWLGGAWFGG